MKRPRSLSCLPLFILWSNLSPKEKKARDQKRRQKIQRVCFKASSASVHFSLHLVKEFVRFGRSTVMSDISYPSHFKFFSLPIKYCFPCPPSARVLLVTFTEVTESAMSPRVASLFSWPPGIKFFNRNSYHKIK